MDTFWIFFDIPPARITISKMVKNGSIGLNLDIYNKLDTLCLDVWCVMNLVDHELRGRRKLQEEISGGYDLEQFHG